MSKYRTNISDSATRLMVLETADAAALAVADTLKRSLTPGQPLRTLWTGGSLTRLVAPVLSEMHELSGQIEIYWGDERAVPQTHTDSNVGLLLNLLAEPFEIKPEQIHKIRGDAPDLEVEAQRYDALLRDVGKMDIALLGVGPDGHVCSLFPGHPALNEKTKMAITVNDSPKPPANRITVTRALLKRCDEVWFFVTGVEKKQVLEEIAFDPLSDRPAAIVSREAKSCRWFVDQAAWPHTTEPV